MNHGQTPNKNEVIIDDNVTRIKVTRATPAIIEVCYDNKKYEANLRHLILRPEKGTMNLV